MLQRCNSQQVLQQGCYGISIIYLWDIYTYIYIYVCVLCMCAFYIIYSVYYLDFMYYIPVWVMPSNFQGDEFDIFLPQTTFPFDRDSSYHLLASYESCMNWRLIGEIHRNPMRYCNTVRTPRAWGSEWNRVLYFANVTLETNRKQISNLKRKRFGRWFLHVQEIDSFRIPWEFWEGNVDLKTPLLLYANWPWPADFGCFPWDGHSGQATAQAIFQLTGTEFGFPSVFLILHPMAQQMPYTSATFRYI